MSNSRPPTPRLPQLYSPRRPSPLGFNPPLSPHVSFQPTPSFSWPHTPDRSVQPKGPPETRMPFPPDARRPLAGSTQRPRSQPPPPLNLEDPHNNPVALLQVPKTAHAGSQQDSTDSKEPPSPTPSEASTLSLYSADSVSKNFPIEVVRQQQEEEKPTSIFCCFNFKSLFGSSKAKEKEAKILGPPQLTIQPAPGPQMVQTRRRPSPLNL